MGVTSRLQSPLCLSTSLRSQMLPGVTRAGCSAPDFHRGQHRQNVPSWCRYERQCGRHGCASLWVCPPQTFVSAYLWQVQDNTPPEALARYDDAWCRVYGPAAVPAVVSAASEDYKRAVTDYRNCLAANPKNANACEGQRHIMDADAQVLGGAPQGSR